jgi:hypothetical protein
LTFLIIFRNIPDNEKQGNSEGCDMSHASSGVVFGLTMGGALLAAFAIVAGSGGQSSQIQQSIAKHAVEDAHYTDITMAYDKATTMNVCGKTDDFARGFAFSARDADGKAAVGYTCVGPKTTPVPVRTR